VLSTSLPMHSAKHVGFGPDSDRPTEPFPGLP
jgi:hypothetical protein